MLSEVSRTFRSVQLAPGGKLTGIDLELKVPHKVFVSGTVVDEDSKPLPGMLVRLVSRQYGYGVLSYGYVATATTERDGRFRIETWLMNGASWFLIEARRPFTRLDTRSTESSDISRRATVVASSFYPGTPFIEDAQAVLVRPDDDVQNLRIRTTHGPAYCVEGKTIQNGAPAAMLVQLGEYRLGAPSSSLGLSADDGSFRICGITAGRYRIIATPAPNSDLRKKLLEAEPGGNQTFMSKQQASQVVDVASDVRDLLLRLESLPSLTMRVEWDKTPDGKQDVKFLPMMLALRSGVGLGDFLSVPGTQTISSVIPGEYAFVTREAPKGFYVKEAVYGGTNLLREVASVGGGVGPDVRFTIGTDGGTIQTAVIDRDGNPVADAFVYIVPSEILPEGAVTKIWVTGNTAQNGVFESPTVAPGKYDVLAIQRQISTVPEDVRALLAARTGATQVTVETGKAAKVEVKQTRVD
jgi:hypothetical protein